MPTKPKKAKPSLATGARRVSGKTRTKSPAKASPSRKVTARLPAGERRAQILQQAFEFFSDHGLTAQTRALAQACGVSQRLLYSLFPNKSSLIQAVYDAEIAGPFKALWFVQLRDHSVPIRDRLVDFYCDYYDTILTRRWLRLQEAVRDAGLRMPEDPAVLQELGWVLHGNVSHLGIRRHIYGNASAVPVRQAVAMHVAAFLAALPLLCAQDPA